MFATLLLAAVLIVGPERPLSPEVHLVPAAANDPMIASAGGRVLLAWTAHPAVRPGQLYQPNSARGRFLGETRDFEIFPALTWGFGVTGDGDSFYALTLNPDGIPTWRTIGRNGELGPVRTLEGVDRGPWGMTATRSRFVFASSDRIVITDHDGRVLQDVRPAHRATSGLLPVGDDFYFIAAERLPPPADGTFQFWLTRLTASGETSSELAGTFDGITGNFGVTAGGGLFLLTIFRNIDDREGVDAFLITPGARNPLSPERIPLFERRTVRGGNGWATGWDGHDFGIASCDRVGDRIVASLTRVGPDGRTAGPDVIGSGFCPDRLWTADGKTTLLGTAHDGEAYHLVAVSAPSFAAMARQKREPEPFETAAVAPIQHSAAFAENLAVWSEDGEMVTAIRGRLLPGGRPFTIAQRGRLYRSAAAAVATRHGYVVAWWESDGYRTPARVIFQQIGRNGALLKRREVAGGPFDVVTALEPAIASNGATIALVSSHPTNPQALRLRLFDSTLEPLATSPISADAGVDPIALASFHTVVPPPEPAHGDVVWDGTRYVVTWLVYPSVNYAFVDERGVAGTPLSAPDLGWLTLRTTTRSSEVVVAGTALCRTEGKLCLQIASLGGKGPAAVRLVPIRPAPDWFHDIQPILFHDLVVIAQRSGDEYDVLAAPIEPNAEFVCISCTPENEQWPAATTIDGHTYVAYERKDPALGNVTRLFFREVTRGR